MNDDRVNHPPHYNVGKIEVIEAIEDWKLGFHLGNAVKYIARAGHKGGEYEELTDLRKARWYLDRYISNAEKGLSDLLDAKGSLKPRWEAVPDCVSIGDDGPMWRVRWSEPDAEGRYLWAAHYGGNGPRVNQIMAEKNAEEWNKQGKHPSECRSVVYHTSPTQGN